MAKAGQIGKFVSKMAGVPRRASAMRNMKKIAGSKGLLPAKWGGSSSVAKKVAPRKLYRGKG